MAFLLQGKAVAILTSMGIFKLREVGPSDEEAGFDGQHPSDLLRQATFY